MIAWLGLAQAQPFADLVQTHALTAMDERKVGQLTFSLSTGFLPTVDDPNMVARVETILRRVIRASDHPGQIVQLRIIDDPTVNAAAYPGGYLLVHRGAVDLFDADELAFVLAHELAHVQLRHYANGNNLNKALDQLSAVERARSGQASPEDHAQLEEIKRLLAHYGRSFEYEADLYGLLFLVRAGRPANKAISALEKLASVDPRKLPDPLDGHPTPAQRVADAKKGLASLERTHERFEQGITALDAGRVPDAVAAFEDFLTVFPNAPAAWTNLAAAHHAALVASSDDPWFERMPIALNSGVRLRSSVDASRAFDAASRALALDPDNPAALAITSSLARLSGQPEHAHTLLDRAEKAGLDPTTVAVNRGVLNGDSDESLRAWEALPDDPFAIANRAVHYERKKQPGLAVPLWKSLIGSRLQGDAVAALKRQGVTPDLPKPPGGLGPAVPGGPVEPVLAALGEPSIQHEGDLDAYYGWPTQGVSVFTYADRIERVRCAEGCPWTLDGVGIGAGPDAIEAKLGNPERHALHHGGEIWFYKDRGATLTVDTAGLVSIEATPTL